ncbi:hypothetical protein WDZ92_23865 [Nostoc sp. NIES-2111]
MNETLPSKLRKYRLQLFRPGNDGQVLKPGDYISLDNAESNFNIKRHVARELFAQLVTGNYMANEGRLGHRVLRVPPSEEPHVYALHFVLPDRSNPFALRLMEALSVAEDGRLGSLRISYTERDEAEELAILQSALAESTLVVWFPFGITEAVQRYTAEPDERLLIIDEGLQLGNLEGSRGVNLLCKVRSLGKLAEHAVEFLESSLREVVVQRPLLEEGEKVEQVKRPSFQYFFDSVYLLGRADDGDFKAFVRAFRQAVLGKGFMWDQRCVVEEVHAEAGRFDFLWERKQKGKHAKYQEFAIQRRGSALEEGKGIPIAGTSPPRGEELAGSDLGFMLTRSLLLQEGIFDSDPEADPFRRPIVILTVGDGLANGVMEAMQSIGKSYPRNFSLLAVLDDQLREQEDVSTLDWAFSSLAKRISQEILLAGSERPKRLASTLLPVSSLPAVSTNHWPDLTWLDSLGAQVAKDHEGRLWAANPLWLSQIDKRFAEVVGKKPSEYWNPDEGKVIELYDQYLLSSQDTVAMITNERLSTAGRLGDERFTCRWKVGEESETRLPRIASIGFYIKHQGDSELAVFADRQNFEEFRPEETPDSAALQRLWDWCPLSLAVSSPEGTILYFNRAMVLQAAAGLGWLRVGEEADERRIEDFRWSLRGLRFEDVTLRCKRPEDYARDTETDNVLQASLLFSPELESSLAGPNSADRYIFRWGIFSQRQQLRAVASIGINGRALSKSLEVVQKDIAWGSVGPRCHDAVAINRWGNVERVIPADQFAALDSPTT